MINIDKAVSIDGWTDPAELVWLATQAQYHNNILEIGSWKGRSTRALADHTPGKVWAVDHWMGPNVDDYWTGPTSKEIWADYEQFYHEVIKYGPEMVLGQFTANLSDLLANDKIVIVRMDSHEAAISLLPTHQGFFDMIFIDGDHSYKQIKSDILDCLPLLAPGGLFCGHDYTWDGVRRAVEETLVGFGVHYSIWYKEIK